MVDINNDEAKQEEAIEQPIEDVKEVVNEVVNEVVEEPPQQETKEVKEEPKQETTKVKAQDRMVRCPKCNKEMKYKNFRYSHQQRCEGGIENKPVKPHTKARAKPIIKQVEMYEVEEPKPVKKEIPPILQPTNPLNDITDHYAILQNQYVQQKKEKYNNLCQNMFAPKSKKR